MAFELMVGLTLRDPAAYAEYRRQMTPLLVEHGGGFRYDFVVSQVLATESDPEINRVFAIFFRDRGSMDAFFERPDYLAIKREHFERAVKTTTIIAEYERD
ncbi:MAG: DUF1330 domain-containing protein [Planctomycetes bacterium]|nr:DUF1330 domain-containing protein [Planctomycetota bacterium]